MELGGKMEKLVNFRDLGGIYTGDKQQVKTGKLFRSGEPVQLSEKEKKQITETYHIERIFDFRSEGEISQRPNDFSHQLSYIPIDLFRDNQEITSSFSQLMAHADLAEEYMLRIYEELVLLPSAKKGYQKFFEGLVDTQQVSLFHCFAGKDRTGVAAALFFSFLDVSKEDIYRDYLKTNQDRREANELILKETKEQNQVNEEQLKSLETMLYVKPNYLDHMFMTVKEHYGSVLGFAKEGLNLPHSFFEELRYKYLDR